MNKRDAITVLAYICVLLGENKTRLAWDKDGLRLTGVGRLEAPRRHEIC